MTNWKTTGLVSDSYLIIKQMYACVQVIDLWQCLEMYFNCYEMYFKLFLFLRFLL